MSSLTKVREQEIDYNISQVMQEKTLNTDSKVLLIGMAISLNDFNFMQIVDRLYTISDSICVPLKNINALVLDNLDMKNHSLIKSLILNIISEKVTKIDTTELEKKLLKVEAILPKNSKY
jgi:hypothetical protein